MDDRTFKSDTRSRARGKKHGPLEVRGTLARECLPEWGQNW